MAAQCMHCGAGAATSSLADENCKNANFHPWTPRHHADCAKLPPGLHTPFKNEPIEEEPVKEEPVEYEPFEMDPENDPVDHKGDKDYYYYDTTAGFKSMRCLYPVLSVRETVPAG